RIMTLYGPGDSRCCMHQSPTRPCTCAVPGPVIDLTGNDADSVPGSSSFGDLGRDPGFLDKEGERERCGYSSRRQRVGATIEAQRARDESDYQRPHDHPDVTDQAPDTQEFPRRAFGSEIGPERHHGA